MNRNLFTYLRSSSFMIKFLGPHLPKSVRSFVQANANNTASLSMRKWLYTAPIFASGMCWWTLEKDRRIICESMRTAFARRLMDIAYAGTDHYGTISDEEEDAVNSTGGHWAYGEISYDGLDALLEHMDVGRDSVFYDFGSGLGKVVAQCFITSQARKVIGIEMAATRHSQAWQACERMAKLLDLIADIQHSSQSLSSWFEEQPDREMALSPSFVLRSRDDDGPRELRLIHGDCLKAGIDDATHIYMANLTWPDAAVARAAARAAALPSVRRVASLRLLPDDPKAARGRAGALQLAATLHVPMSWQVALLAHWKVWSRPPQPSALVR